MNELNPELRRLIQWSRTGHIPADETVPPGFGARVAVRWQAQNHLPPAWSWGPLERWTAWACTLVLMASLGLWASQRAEPAMAYDLLSVYQVAVRNLTP